MGWWLTAADLPSTAPLPDHSLTVALIAAIGAVLVALITIGLPLLRQPKQPEAAPAPLVDPKFGERVAVIDDRVKTGQRTLEQLDRYVHGVDDDLDKLRGDHERLRWEHDDFVGRVTDYMRRHGSP